jgi:hypothetical protein
MPPSSPLLFDLLSMEVVLLVNSQAMLDYSKVAEALKDVLCDTLALQHGVPSLHGIGGGDLEEKGGVAPGIICSKGKNWDKSVADIYDIRSLLLLIHIATGPKGLHHRGLCPYPSPPSLKDC